MQLQLVAHSSSCSGFPLFLLFPILYTISFMTRTTSRSPSSHSHSHYEFICEVFHLNCQYAHWYDKDHLDMKSMKTTTVYVSYDAICYLDFPSGLFLYTRSPCLYRFVKAWLTRCTSCTFQNSASENSLQYFGSIVPNGYLQSVIGIGNQDSDIIMLATCLIQAAGNGMSKKGTKCFWMICD